MKHTSKTLVIGAALAGLLGGTAARADTHSHTKGEGQAMHKNGKGEGKEKAATDKHGCAGKNSCKGKGGCKTGDNGCHGKNSCKGKGGCATDGSMKQDKKEHEAEKPKS